jgi:hypothetical protein
LFSFLRKEQIRIQKEQEKELRELQRRQAHSKKLEEENRKRKEAEEMIKLLENEERELVNRLRRTQAMQQEVRTKGQTNLTNFGLIIFLFYYFIYLGLYGFTALFEYLKHWNLRSSNCYRDFDCAWIYFFVFRFVFPFS